MSTRIGSFLILAIMLVLAACSPAATQESATETPELELVELTQALDPTSEPEPSEPEDESTFTLDPEQSEARFIIGEILANAPNTVVGVNNQVQGGGVLNFADPGLSTLDEFLIDASSFVTDSSFRNRAIREFILQSSEHPTISFQPTGIAGIPNEITIGETVPFEVTGLLTIRDITQEVTFIGEATVVERDRVEGLASANVFREDFELTIPSVPRVAGVDEEFIIEIDFVAIAG